MLLTAHQLITMKRFYKENHQFVARIDGGNGGNQSHGNGWVMDQRYHVFFPLIFGWLSASRHIEKSLKHCLILCQG